MLRNDPGNTRILFKPGIKYRYDYDDGKKASVYFNRILENKDDAVNHNVEFRMDVDNPINLYEYTLFLTRKQETLRLRFPEIRFSDYIKKKN